MSQTRTTTLTVSLFEFSSLAKNGCLGIYPDAMNLFIKLHRSEPELFNQLVTCLKNIIHLMCLSY